MGRKGKDNLGASKIIATDRDPGYFFEFLANTHKNARTRGLEFDNREVIDQLVADVPCGTCTKCCTAGYDLPVHEWEYTREFCEAFSVKVGQDTVKRYRIKKQEDGACIHFLDGKCSIYETRYSVCKVFDCRDQAATGIADKDLVEAVKQWDLGQWLATSEVRWVMTALRMAANAHLKKGDTAVTARDRALATFPQYMGAAAMEIAENETWDTKTYTLRDLYEKAKQGKIADFALAALFNKTTPSDPECVTGFSTGENTKVVQRLLRVVMKNIRKFNLQKAGKRTVH